MSTLLSKARSNLLQSIRGGEFDVGDVLPAAHELASRMRCSPATMEKALLKLANDGVDTRTIQGYLGHKSIQHTVRYTELAPTRFKSLFRD